MVFSKNEEEHYAHLDIVFKLLYENQLYLNPEKSSFFKTKIEYLGHIVSGDGIRVDPKKIKCIQEWPRPQSIHEICSFLRLCSYYKNFIQNFSYIALPLTNLLKKSTSFHWTEKFQKSFNVLKYTHTHAPILQLLDFK